MTQLRSKPKTVDASTPTAAVAHANLILMIIKGLFRRYERWNPVHPTLGTFWGVGVGIGCGIGWGPGFGPEVIGYVGAGCGVGFSVGITLAGIGVGLPQNGLMQIPYKALATNFGFQRSASSDEHITMKSIAEDMLDTAAPHVFFMSKEATERFSRFRMNVKYVQGIGEGKLNNAVSKQIQSTLECLEAFKDHFWPPGKDE